MVSVLIFISVCLTSVTLRVQNQIKEGGGAKEVKRRERVEDGREEGEQNGWKKERKG